MHGSVITSALDPTSSCAQFHAEKWSDTAIDRLLPLNSRVPRYLVNCAGPIIYFHTHCIAGWFLENNTCPTCRGRVGGLRRRLAGVSDLECDWYLLEVHVQYYKQYSSVLYHESVCGERVLLLQLLRLRGHTQPSGRVQSLH